MYSIRLRLTLVLALGFTVLIGGAGVFAASSLSARAQADFDATLLTQARALLALTEQEEGRIEFDYHAELMPQYERQERPDYFQFWLDDGQVLLRSARLDRDLPRASPAQAITAARDLTLPDGRVGRMVQFTWIPLSAAQATDIGDTKDPAEPTPTQVEGPQHAVILVLARERTALDELIASMHFAVFGAGAAAALLGVLLAWYALAAGLRPIESMAAQVKGLDAEALDARVVLPTTPRELAPIVDQLNALLQRLAAAFGRERRFAGNLAHELRTPIAELRSLAAVGRKWPDDTASVAGFFQDVDAIAGHMGTLVTDLLLLARCQAGIERVVRTAVRPSEAIHAAWAAFAADARARGIEWHADIDPDLVVRTDPGKLAIILANVLGNAVHHARAPSRVVCTVTRDDATVLIDIVNAAEPLPQGELARLTEPFVRHGTQKPDSQHVGLGLSMATALAGLMGLTIAIAQDQDGTFRVRIDGLTFDPTASMGLRRAE